MRFVPIIARTWLSQQVYGWRFAPNIDTFPLPYLYVKIIIFAVGADSLHNAERVHIQGLVDTLVSDPEPDLVHFIQHYSADEQKLASSPSFLASTSSLTSPVLARVLLYDAVTASCTDDDYDVTEKANVARVAHHFGLPTDRVQQIEQLAMRELEIRQRKTQLLRRHPPPSHHHHQEH